MTAARLVTLRKGRAGRTLFVIPGSGGRAEELAGLAAALPDGWPVVGVEPFVPDAEGRAPATVEAMADQAAAAIRARQPVGPYRLLGYSFGGLTALETARRLEAAGQTVAFTGLVDSLFDRSHWPMRLFLAATLRRAGGHLARLARRPPGEALPELAARARRLGQRVAARTGVGVEPSAGPDGSRRALCDGAQAAWRPRAFTGPATLFASADGSDFGVSPAALWPPWIAELTVRPMAGAHLALVREPAALAEAVGEALAASEAPRRPRALIATSFTWISSARLALDLTQAGFAVEAVCPRRHSLTRLAFPDRAHRFDTLRAERSLRRAIEAARPDLIIPCDDRTVQALHALYAAADPDAARGAELRGRLARSLGRPETFDWVYSRAATMVVCEEEGLRCPPTGRVRSLEDVRAWRALFPGPAVLKTDGSWGGREVIVARDEAEAGRAWRRLSAPPRLARALKRLLLDGDRAPIRASLARRRPQVSVQVFVEGRPGNAAVACLDGQVLAAVCVEVVASDGAAGPATVVRVIDHPEMVRAVTAMVRRLGLNGLCGFDFILGPDGAAHLIEVNPRATPTSHLVAADGACPLSALAAALGREAAPKRREAYADGMVALFPQELRRDPVSGFLQSAHHDVPWHAPELVEAALAEGRGLRGALERTARRLAPRAD